MSRSAHCSRASVARAGAAPEQRAERVVGVQRAVRAAADVVRAAPVEELVAGRAPRPAPRRPCGSAAPTTRGRARPGTSPTPTRPSSIVQAEQVEVALDAPALAARVHEVAARREAQLLDAAAALAAHDRLAVRVVAHAHHEVDALEREQRALDARDQLARGGRGRARRPARRASSGRPRSRRLGRARRAARQHRSRRTPGTGRSPPPPSTASGREQTITAWSSRNASAPPAGSIMRASWRSAAASESTCANGPYLCECVSLSGSESSRKSNRSCSTRYSATQPECWSRTPGQPELRAARRLAARRTGRRRRARAGPYVGMAEDRRARAGSARCRPTARGGGGRGTSGTSCRPCGRRASSRRSNTVSTSRERCSRFML